jgi:hypothetical protein
MASVPKLPVRELNPDKIRQRRLKQLLETAQLWIIEQGLILPDIEYVQDRPGKLLYLHRIALRRVPVRVGTPDELLMLVRQKEAVENYKPAKLEFWANWLARWLASCLPGDEELQDELLREFSKWARSSPWRFVY